MLPKNRSLILVLAVIREAYANARSQKAFSILTLVIVAGMCAAVILTTGRSVAAQESVLATLDAAGTESIIVRSDPESGITTEVVSRLRSLDDVRWFAVLGSAHDVENQALPGSRVTARQVFGSSVAALGMRPAEPQRGPIAFASANALEALRMLDASGAVREAESGRELNIAGEFRTPSFLRDFDPLVLEPAAVPTDPAPVTLIVVVARSASMVSPVSHAVEAVLGASDGSKVKVQTGVQLAQLRSRVDIQLRESGRSLAFTIFIVTGLLVVTIQYGLTLLRRKDFGRRRALGASKSLVIALLLTQMGLLSLVGTALGAVAALAALAAVREPVPSVQFVFAVALMAVGICLVSAAGPAIVASRSDPLRELRIP